MEHVYIPKDDMIDYCIYLCNARNFKYGIWRGDKMYGIRHKFGDTFIDGEYHWDEDATGTCQPLIRLTDKLTDRIHPSFFDVSNWRGQCVLHDILAGFEALLPNVTVCTTEGLE